MSILIDELPLTFDAHVIVSDALTATLRTQRAAVEKTGCKVTSFHVSGEDVPPRLFITFEPGTPSFQVRGELEKVGFDVGQQMGDKMLRFYASKRVVKGTGWEV